VDLVLLGLGLKGLDLMPLLKVFTHIDNWLLLGDILAKILILDV
jgi:hypothetical protein